MNKEMSIIDAINTYKADGVKSIYPGFRSLIEDLIEQDVCAKFDNDSYLDALFLTDTMLLNTNKSIKMVCGSGCDSFLDTLKVTLEKTLSRIRSNKGFVRVIVLASVAPKILDELKESFKGAFDYKLASISSDVRHFIACDGKMVRIEEPHAELSEDSLADLIKADVSFCDQSLARLYEGIFDEGWSKL